MSLLFGRSSRSSWQAALVSQLRETRSQTNRMALEEAEASNRLWIVVDFDRAGDKSRRSSDTSRTSVLVRSPFSHSRSKDWMIKINAQGRGTCIRRGTRDVNFTWGQGRPMWSACRWGERTRRRKREGSHDDFGSTIGGTRWQTLASHDKERSSGCNVLRHRRMGEWPRCITSSPRCILI